MAVRTIGTLLGEARVLLQDSNPLPAYRYTDNELLQSFNGALLETFVKRPDLFLRLGLRGGLPFYGSADLALPFPLDLSVYQAFLYYVVGRSELREDTFVSEGRAVVLMNKFVSQLTAVAS